MENLKSLNTEDTEAPLGALPQRATEKNFLSPRERSGEGDESVEVIVEAGGRLVSR